MDPTARELARMIDHALLHPSLSDAEIGAGCAFARSSNVASACVKPYSIPLARDILAGSEVLVCAVIGFPHGNSTTGIKVAEAESAVLAGALEIDMVVNVGKVKGGEWHYVRREIDLINQAVVGSGGILKVIFETDYLTDAEIVRLCVICSEAAVAFVKTSTGFGFVKQGNGDYNYRGATIRHLELMREHTASQVRIKASGGVRTLDDLLACRAAGATRFGTSATEVILRQGISREGND